jgi:prepilin-type N-terminal cleavage/methylation domain-containing protein
LKPTRPTARPARPQERPEARPAEDLLHLTKRLFGEQAGYTLIEMVMVIAILGILSMAVNQAIVHTVRISSHGTDSMTAISQLENAFRWVNIDVQQSQIIEPEMGNGFPLSLSWVGWNGAIHAVTYTVQDGELTRNVFSNGAPVTQMAIARYLDPDTAVTNCRLTGKGNFSLTDIGDTFTITGGQQSSSGQISVTTGSVSVTTTGTATFHSGAWSTPAAGDQVIVRANGADTKGTWNSANTGASLALTQDDDGDASLRGSALILILTAFGGESSANSETRESIIFSRS